MAEYFAILVQHENVGRTAPGLLFDDFHAIEQNAAWFAGIMMYNFDLFHKKTRDKNGRLAERIGLFD